MSEGILTPQFIKPQVHPSGPRDADIMIVGEAPGSTEVERGEPFVGVSGQELDRMLHEAGILRTEVFCTNVARVQPSDNKIEHFFHKMTNTEWIPGPVIESGIADLMEEISLVRPKVIIALGNVSLWALTGNKGITKWRGSQLRASYGSHTCTVLPTYHPAAILRQWSWRFAAVCDLKRARRELNTSTVTPPYDFTVRPSFSEAMTALQSIPSGVASLDLETRGGHIACAGIGTSPLRAFCIPFMCVERNDGYWTEEEELALVLEFRKQLLRPDIKWVLQNGLYDHQYIARFWAVVPSVWMDTMLAWHVCYPGTPKGLDYLSSLLCDFHEYWKDESKEWGPELGEDQLWLYNCKDCVTTWECSAELDTMIDQLSLRPQFEFQMQQFWNAFWMMFRGVRCDRDYKGELMISLDSALREIEDWIDTALGGNLPRRKKDGRLTFIRSSKQKLSFFNDELGLPVQRDRKTKRPTANDEALAKFETLQPLLHPLTSRIRNASSVGVFSSTFAGMRLDTDGRIRCSYNVSGTETFRWSSSKNAFGSGANLQNIPKGGEEADPGLTSLPNIKLMFIPDPGMTFFDADLKQADAQVVAWEADDDELKAIFREGANLHLENAKLLFPDLHVTPDSVPYKHAKAGVHATNYGASANTLARTLGILVRDAERFQRRWFGAHPGIRKWHERVDDSLQTTRSVSNAFGFRIHYFDRVDRLLPEALAWIPQSTVAIVISHGLQRIRTQTDEPGLEALLQVHDSIAGQFPTTRQNPSLRAIQRAMRVPIPYPDPLTIPVDIGVSDTSWGACKAVDVPL